MKRLSFLTVIVLAGMILSACGAPAAPTMNPADVQSTAQAAAMTMVAETQAAVPTVTPLPPTETPTQTPVATDTPLPLPTLAVSLTPTTAPAGAGNGNATVDPCSNRILSYSPKGKPTIIRIANTTKATVNVSLYLNETEGHGECGYRAYKLSKNNDVVITDLVYGCYSLYAWSDDPKEKFNASGGGCINNPDKWTFEISAGKIKFIQ